jgi:hypothetical protein
MQAAIFGVVGNCSYARPCSVTITYVDYQIDMSEWTDVRTRIAYVFMLNNGCPSPGHCPLPLGSALRRFSHPVLNPEGKFVLPSETPAYAECPFLVIRARGWGPPGGAPGLLCVPIIARVTLSLVMTNCSGTSLWLRYLSTRKKVRSQHFFRGMCFYEFQIRATLEWPILRAKETMV